MAAYNYLNQYILASALIEPKDYDSFYHPTTQGHTGYAADGKYYLGGVLQEGHASASWYSESFGPYRGSSAAFPNAGIIVLSKVALSIMDETSPYLALWMQFLLADTYALANNFNDTLQGFQPKSLAYADGVISVTYAPDPGSEAVTSNMVVHLDFTQDKVYLDVAL